MKDNILDFSLEKKRKERKNPKNEKDPTKVKKKKLQEKSERVLLLRQKINEIGEIVKKL